MSTKRSLALLLAVLALAACAGTRPKDLPPAPASSFTVSVRGGESLAAVATRYQVKEDDLLALNTIPERKSLKAGRIRIPAYGWDREPISESAPDETSRTVGASRETATRTTLASSARVESRPLNAPASASGRQPQIASNASPAKRSSEAAAQQQTAHAGQPLAQPSWWDGWFASAQPQQAAAATAPHDTFLWPVSGRVISSFGQSADGGRNDGINISTKLGTPIRAADVGTVSYVGNELKGYGNLILIRHDNGYVTAYAHAERIDVQRGDRVARGQVIGSAGDTGDVQEPQLHFELRLGTRPVDPTPYLVASK